MKLDFALSLADEGFRVFPLQPNTKIPLKGLAWKDAATMDRSTIERWWAEHPDANIGVATGRGVIVLDADVAKGRKGLESLAMLDMMGLPEDTLRVQTPSGGVHVYLKTDLARGNRVDTIEGFPGIDLRGENGYVVGPGSTIDERSYAGAHKSGVCALAYSPTWLNDVLDTTPKALTPKSDQPLVELDNPEHIKRAIFWLENAAPEAVEGAGGDHTTYSVACRLRDHGLSPDTAFELLLEHWNEQKASPPWSPDDLREKVTNAYGYATGGWGAHTAAAEFDVVDLGDMGVSPLLADQTQNPNPGAGMHFLDYDEMKAMPEPEWLIEGVIQKRTAALLFGKSNTFKSFLAIDAGLSVATGRDWHGREVKQGKVLFVATEGANGVGRLRIPGWYGHYDVPEDERGAAWLYPKEICLDLKTDVDALIKTCLAIGGFSLIVFDIFGGTMAGSEVEDTTARAWVHAIQRVMRATGAATLTVAHTGWQDETRARMHTHFWGSFDSRMRVEGDKAQMTTCLTIERHKDADSTGAWGFRLEAAQGTLVPVYDEAIEAQKGSGWPPALKVAMRALDEALEQSGIVKVDPDWPSCRIVEIGLWRERCDALELSSSDNKETRRKAFQRAREGLAKRGAIEMQEDFVWSKFDEK